MTKASTTTAPWTGFITEFVRKHKIVAVNAPSLLSGQRSPSGHFYFQTRLAVGSKYEVQASSDMRDWNSIATGTAQTDLVEHTDSDASKFSFRFYRTICGEVISKNIIGYASITLPRGFAMISNPFNAPSNRISDLFPEMPEGTTFCKFDTSSFRLTNNSVKGGQWINPDEKLMPGEGAILFNPTGDFKPLTFVGEVCQGHLVNQIPAGLSICSSIVAQPGQLNTDLGFPICEGDVVHIFDRDQQKYVLYPYSASAWVQNPPVIGIGESFWISKTQPALWSRDFAAS